MNHRHTPLPLLAAAAAAVLLFTMAAGCGPKMIEGTKIEDTPDTQDVVRTVERYRRAMEDRDAETIIKMSAPTYFEKNGNSNSRDNYDYEGLVKLLRSERFGKISKLRLVIIYKKITFNEERNRAEVECHYILNFRKPPEQFQQKVQQKEGETVVEDNFDEERWYSKADDNLIVLVKDPKTGRWLIERGM